MLFQRSRGSNTMKTILRGSQWGDGFYGWQLNVWLFYGYDSSKITQSGTLEKFLRLKFLLGLTIKLYQFYAYSLIFFSRFNPIKTPLTDSTSKAQNNGRVTCMKDSYLYGQSKQFIFIEYTIFLLFLSIFFSVFISQQGWLEWLSKSHQNWVPRRHQSTGEWRHLSWRNQSTKQWIVSVRCVRIWFPGTGGRGKTGHERNLAQSILHTIPWHWKHLPWVTLRLWISFLCLGVNR